MTFTQTSSNTGSQQTNIAEFEELARKVDASMQEVQALPIEQRAKATALKLAIEAFHRAGLTQIVRTLKSDPRGKELLFQLVQMPEVYALFSMHGLVRADLRTQTARVLEMVRPYMMSHGGDVSLVDVRDRIVYVKLTGNCNGCSMSQVTLKKTVAETLKEHLPEIDEIRVVDEPEVVQISLVRELSESTDAGWIEGPAVDDLPSDRPYAFSHSGIDMLVVRSPKGLRAYRNACAHQGLPLDGGLVDEESGTITCPWHGFSFDMESGECFTAPQCQLEPFPLRVSDGKVWIRPHA